MLKEVATPTFDFGNNQKASSSQLDYDSFLTALTGWDQQDFGSHGPKTQKRHAVSVSSQIWVIASICVAFLALFGSYQCLLSGAGGKLTSQEDLQGGTFKICMYWNRVMDILE